MVVSRISLYLCILMAAFAFTTCVGERPLFNSKATYSTDTSATVGAFNGPLKVSPLNPRYFTDASGKAIYLTGSHTWANLQDFQKRGSTFASFNYTAHLDFLKKYNHNFIRLWAWESSTIDKHLSIQPLPFLRTGPGSASDGGSKYDLFRFNNAYFDRLRSRVMEAGNRGIYVMVMLFQGASVNGASWVGHPYNAANNINHIDGDADGDGSGNEIHTLKVAGVRGLQEAYIRRVIDTLNDLDNVLYEIANEVNGEATDWQYHMVNAIHDYEKTKPKQHPVAMTDQIASEDDVLFNSPAAAISPGDGSYREDPPAADGSKVIISDTDHQWGTGGDQRWVWKSFLRGINPIFMDPYDGKVGGKPFDPAWESARRNMGYTLTYARRINLTAMVPRGDLVSSGYCLANPGEEYLVYLASGSGTVDLSAASRDFSVEWFDPRTGKAMPAAAVAGGAKRTFTAPFTGDAVLYLTVSP